MARHSLDNQEYADYLLRLYGDGQKQVLVLSRQNAGLPRRPALSSALEPTCTSIQCCREERSTLS